MKIDYCEHCGGELERTEGLCNRCDSACPDYDAAYERNLEARAAYREQFTGRNDY